MVAVVLADPKIVCGETPGRSLLIIFTCVCVWMMTDMSILDSKDQARLLGMSDELHGMHFPDPTTM